MSHTYELACIDCGEVLNLGKIACFDLQHQRIPWQFGGWWEGDEAVDGSKLWPIVERFLIVHRNHEVRLLTEDYLDKLDPEGRLRYLWNPKGILQRPIDPEPDDEFDARQVPEHVGEKLKKRFRTDEEIDADWDESS